MSLCMNVEFSDSLSAFGLVDVRFLSFAFGFLDFFVFGVLDISGGTDCVSISFFSLRYLMVIFCNLSAPFFSTIVEASICSSMSSAKLFIVLVSVTDNAALAANG